MSSHEYDIENFLYLTDNDENKHAIKYLVRQVVFITYYTLALSSIYAYYQVTCELIWYNKVYIYSISMANSPKGWLKRYLLSEINFGR